MLQTGQGFIFKSVSNHGWGKCLDLLFRLLENVFVKSFPPSHDLIISHPCSHPHLPKVCPEKNCIPMKSFFQKKRSLNTLGGRHYNLSKHFFLFLKVSSHTLVFQAGQPSYCFSKSYSMIMKYFKMLNQHCKIIQLKTFDLMLNLSLSTD